MNPNSPKQLDSAPASDTVERTEVLDAIGSRLRRVLPSPPELSPELTRLLVELERRERDLAKR